MNLLVTRFISNDNATLSVIELNNKFECFGLEDEHRTEKVDGKTRIPAGRYTIGVRDVGGFHGRYSKRYPWHMGMLELQNVPGFEYVLIHIGNDDDDTAGCLLVGNGCNTSGDEFTVTSSANAYKSLYNKVILSAVADDLTITIIDRDW